MNLLGIRTTRNHLKYWVNRKLDWEKAYFDLWNHPHRQMIVDRLKEMRVASVLEIGCASGPNCFRIKKEFPWMDVGGVDVNQQAIDTAKRMMPSSAGRFFIGRADRIFFSDKASDVILTDMALIYVDPWTINKAIKEIRRVARKYVIFCEFHHPSLLKRWQLRLKSPGYHAYNYQELLEKHGFYDIVIAKIPEALWPNGEPQKTFGYVITARL